MVQADSTAGLGLREALREARMAEAMHREAVADIRDSKSLRLHALKLEIDVVVAASPEARQNFDVAISPRDPPRLWLDPISFVDMEPDYRTYRLVQDTSAGREVVAETTDLMGMVEHVKRLLAHRVIARERQVAGTSPKSIISSGYSSSAVILAWLSGVALGALALLGASILLKQL